MSELKRFKHNYNNMLAVIGGYIQLESWNDLKKYYFEILDQTNKFDASNNLSIFNIKNAGILGLLTTKMNYAKELHVDLKIVVYNNIEEINMKISELHEILGIILDNAIEAAKQSNERIQRISQQKR